MAAAKVFKSGNGQAVPLPEEIQLAGREVAFFRRGDEIVLREKQRNVLRALDILAHLPGDCLVERFNPPPELRKDQIPFALPMGPN
jgi:antitoxin VapB